MFRVRTSPFFESVLFIFPISPSHFSKSDFPIFSGQFFPKSVLLILQVRLSHFFGPVLPTFFRSVLPTFASHSFSFFDSDLAIFSGRSFPLFQVSRYHFLSKTFPFFLGQSFLLFQVSPSHFSSQTFQFIESDLPSFLVQSFPFYVVNFYLNILSQLFSSWV